MNIDKLKKVAISDFYYHEDFDPKNGNNDVGLMKIVGTFGGKNVAPIPIAQHGLPTGTIVTVSGWGNTMVSYFISISKYYNYNYPSIDFRKQNKEPCT